MIFWGADTNEQTRQDKNKFIHTENILGPERKGDEGQKNGWRGLTVWWWLVKRFKGGDGFTLPINTELKSCTTGICIMLHTNFAKFSLEWWVGNQLYQRNLCWKTERRQSGKKWYDNLLNLENRVVSIQNIWILRFKEVVKVWISLATKEYKL